MSDLRSSAFRIPHFRIPHFQPYRHRVALGRVLEGVVNQVDQGLLEGFAVGGELIVGELMR